VRHCWRWCVSGYKTRPSIKSTVVFEFENIMSTSTFFSFKLNVEWLESLSQLVKQQDTKPPCTTLTLAKRVRSGQRISSRSSKRAEVSILPHPSCYRSSLTRPRSTGEERSQCHWGIQGSSDEYLDFSSFLCSITLTGDCHRCQSFWRSEEPRKAGVGGAWRWDKRVITQITFRICRLVQLFLCQRIDKRCAQ